MNKTKNVGAIILAAGRGTRMKSGDVNKVALVVNKKPLILRTIEKLKQAGISEIVVVVGFAKESVIKLLPDDVKYVVQKEQLGTADAEKAGLTKISSDIENILSVSGDDSFLYNPEVFVQMIKKHIDSKSDMTLATVTVEDPKGLGRIIRDEAGNIMQIVEELSATENEKEIKEINAGCYLFKKQVLDLNINKIKINKMKGEFYLTDILEILVENKFIISSFNVPASDWKGINTPEELKIAEQALKNNEK